MVRRLTHSYRAIGLPLLLAALLSVTAAGADSERPAFCPTADAEQIGDYWRSYDGRTRNSRWVYERLTAKSVANRVDREGMAFRVDDRLPKECRSSPADWNQSGYDLGHLAPAADHGHSRAALEATFVVSNATPQAPALNRGEWRRLEEYVRSLTADGTVHVITCPLWLPAGNHVRPREGLRTDFYSIVAVGKNRVWVPTHIGKSVLIERDGEPPRLATWILPNESDVQRFETYAVSVDAFEAAAGFDLWAALPDEVEDDLEAVP